MKLQEAFIGTDSRLRSGWRALIFTALYIVASLILTLLAGPVMYALSGRVAMIFVISSLVGLIPAIGLGWLCGKYLEGLPFRALGTWFTGGWAMHLIAGILIGTATIALAVLLASTLGDLDFSFNTPDSGAIA